MEEEFIHLLGTLTLKSQELLCRSEERIETISNLVNSLIEPMSKHHVEIEEQNMAYEKRISENRMDNQATVALYEEKLKRLSQYCEEIQSENKELVSMLAARKRQIEKLENILLTRLNQTNITVGDFKTKKDK